MANWTETRMELDHVLELERVLARKRRQQQWQRFLQHGKRLQVFLARPWLARTLAFTKHYHSDTKPESWRQIIARCL